MTNAIVPHDKQPSAMKGHRGSTRLPGAVGHLLFSLESRVLMNWVNLRWGLPKPPARRHGLPNTLVVSLTSYRPRFPNLATTLKCLLYQSIKPDAVVLWVDRNNIEYLPDDVKRLRGDGLEIEVCEELHSFAKIIPSLIRYPAAFIATADDDTFYPRTWLEDLVRSYRTDVREIVCHRARIIRLEPDGTPKPYTEWPIADCDTPAELVFPTGAGGVLYPPTYLHPDVTNIEKFRQLCPFADDVWLFWMAVRNQVRFRKIGSNPPMISWPGTQAVSLWQENVVRAGNDQQIANMIRCYGIPWENGVTESNLKESPVRRKI